MEQSPSSPPQQKSRKTLWIVIGVAVLVACCGGGYFFANRDDDPKPAAVTDNSPSPAVTASQAPSAAPTTTPTKPVTLTAITLTMPAKLGGRPISKDPKLVAAAAQSAKAQQSVSFYFNATGQQVEFTNAVAAFYGSGKSLVMAVAAKTSTPMSGADLDKEFKRLIAVDGVSKAGDAVTVDAGKMGGSARCADIELSSGTAKVPAAICMWVDHGSIGYLTWYNKTVAQAKGELVTLRGQIEHQK